MSHAMLWLRRNISKLVKNLHFVIRNIFLQGKATIIQLLLSSTATVEYIKGWPDQKEFPTETIA